MTRMFLVTGGGGCGGSRSGLGEEQDKQSIVDSVLIALRKSMAATCRMERVDQEVVSTAHHMEMEIGWPTDVQHITHVTFDRFHGFLGLPLEFEVEIPCKAAPSASASVCGVSAESMQWSYDSRGNSVPTILLLMQEKLYVHGGLKAEGIFRINPENNKEEYVRDELNRGIVPEDIDVHCLAGLIKAWFRDLPSGVLDGLSPEQVLECNTVDESVELVKQLKPTQRALLSWAIDLMADVVEQEEFNKMNARNIAMVFAPNMTQMLNPLTALKHAVQVMNLLKTLILKRLQEREEAAVALAAAAYTSRLSHFSDGRREMVGLVSKGEEEQEGYYSSCNEDRDEIESLSETEYCFLRQLDENENAKDGFRKQLERILCREHPSPANNPNIGTGSHILQSHGEIGSSCIDNKMSGLSSIGFRP